MHGSRRCSRAPPAAGDYLTTCPILGDRYSLRRSSVSLPDSLLAIYVLPLVSFGAWRILRYADRAPPISSLIQPANSRSG